MTGLTDGGDLWRLMLHHSPIGMAVVAPDGKLLLANRALCEMLGYDEAELTRRGFQELTHPDDLDADLSLYTAILAGEIDSYRLPKRYLHADGHFVWGDLSVALVRDADGEPLHFISQVLDITEQRQNEERLEAARAEMEAIFETVAVGLLLIGPDGTYERMNRRHRDTMHMPFPEGHDGAAGQLGAVYHLDGRPMAREEMPSYRATQGEEFDDYTYWVGTDPAKRQAFSTSARQVRGPSGERRGAALAYQEITDLIRAMQVKDEFVASVSHELRTPLTSVLGYIEMMFESGELPESAAGPLRVVQRNSLRLQALLSDLLQVGQADAAGHLIQRAQVDLAALVRDAVEAAGVAQKGRTLRVDAPDRLTIAVDEHRIRQVVDNLLSNAIKYTPAGGSVRLTLTAVSDHVDLEVSDTGIGIAPDELPHVFDRFFRAAGVRSDQIPGTGLGLDIVSSIVGAHGGTVTVESEVGRGTTFRVVLPGLAS